MPCGRRRAESYPARLRLVGWTAPEGATHVVCRGYLGTYPPQLVPEHLVPVVQHRLELVQVGANDVEQCELLSSSMTCRQAA